jgi:hypothetical protein
LGITEIPTVIQVTICKKAIAQYYVGHQKLVSQLKEQLLEMTGNRITLLGNSYHGVSINDCIGNSMEAVRDFSFRDAIGNATEEDLALNSHLRKKLAHEIVDNMGKNV